MTHAVAVSGRPWPWLRNAKFDLHFIVGLPILAIATALVVVYEPRLFIPILIIDLWFLGYHHVIATYTQLCFDRKSFSERWPLLVVLLPAVAVGTIAVAWVVGIWSIVTLYFYWQWFHYTRQSWGISRAYRAKDKDALYEDGWLDQAIFYAVPVLGLLYRSWQNPGTFIGLELKLLAMPQWVVIVAAIATAILLGIWVVRRVQAYMCGRLATTHTLYMITHFAIFGFGYLLIEDITYGWLAINIWHNAQYILFVWMYNTRRFKDGIDPNARFLSYISQPQRFWIYMAACIGITGIIYVGVLGTLDALFVAGLSATIVLYQIVNFHHYIVDSQIWKVRAAPVRKTLGIDG